MELLFLIILIIIVWYLYSTGKREGTGHKGSFGKRNSENIIWIVDNNTRKDVGKFENGVIHALPQYRNGSPWVVGYYDEKGNVYNVDRSLIGNIDSDGRITLLKEYQFEEMKKSFPDAHLTKQNAELWRRIGESLGDDVGTIFEGTDCENDLAHYETNGKNDIVGPMVGAGAAYIALVYEMIIPSSNREFYTPNPSQWFEKQQNS